MTPTAGSYSAEFLASPPLERAFPGGTDPAAALASARTWVEDQARTFLGEHSLPRNPWVAGRIRSVGPKRSGGETLAELAVYTDEGDYVFEWDDEK